MWCSESFGLWFLMLLFIWRIKQGRWCVVDSRIKMREKHTNKWFCIIYNIYIFPFCQIIYSVKQVSVCCIDVLILGILLSFEYLEALYKHHSFWSRLVQMTPPPPQALLKWALGLLQQHLENCVFCTLFASVYRLSCLCLAIESSVSYSGFTNNLNSFYSKILSEPFLLFEMTTVPYSFILKSNLYGWFLRWLLVFKNLK